MTTSHPPAAAPLRAAHFLGLTYFKARGAWPRAFASPAGLAALGKLPRALLVIEEPCGPWPDAWWRVSFVLAAPPSPEALRALRVFLGPLGYGCFDLSGQVWSPVYPYSLPA